MAEKAAEKLIELTLSWNKSELRAGDVHLVMDKRLLTDLTATPGKERSIFRDNSKHCKNLYVGGVGVSLQRVACSLPILLCWFEILALQNLQAFSKHEVTNVNVCTKHKSFFVVHENLFILHL